MPATNGEATPAMRLQILSTEHWSLLASRSLAWNEVLAGSSPLSSQCVSTPVCQLSWAWVRWPFSSRRPTVSGASATRTALTVFACSRERPFAAV